MVCMSHTKELLLSHNKIKDRNVSAALKNFQQALKNLYGYQTPIIFLYGSYARGDYKPSSDVDVLLLYEDDIHPAQEIHRISAILANLNLEHQVLISVYPIGKKQINQAAGPLWINIQSEGISINE